MRQDLQVKKGQSWVNLHSWLLFRSPDWCLYFGAAKYKTQAHLDLHNHNSVSDSRKIDMSYHICLRVTYTIMIMKIQMGLCLISVCLQM